MNLMNRRQVLTTLAGALPGFAFAAEKDATSRKKGWAGGNESLHQLFGAHWFYTWTPASKNSPGLEFVPMIKTGGNLKQAGAIARRNGTTSVLGFNEPERRKQGNLTVDQAIQLWPRLESAAKRAKLRLGSPAPSSNAAGLKWLEQFMKRADSQKLHVDFIAVHWYRGTDADQFEDFVEGLGKKYDRPVWITEFNGWSGEEKVHYKFLKDSLRFLERSRHVERYAYFNVKAGKPHSLVKPDGSPTRMGELYRDAGT